MPQKALVDPNLEALLRHLAKAKKQAFQKRTNNKATPWLRPPLKLSSEWDGDLQTEAALIAIHASFNTDVAEAALTAAFTPGDPGNSSDGIVLSLQIDYAAQAERAFRARNTQTFPRALAHYSSREKGHGQDDGALLGMALEYFTQIIKQGSEGSGGPV
jgi:hypothetical protein